MKKIVILTLIALSPLAAQAQNGAENIPQLGKAFFASFQNNTIDLASKYFVGKAELKVLKGATNEDEDKMVQLLVQKTVKDLTGQWAAAYAKLEADGLDWKNAANPAVSHEPFQKDGREYTILQVMFKYNDKMFTLSAVCVQVNGLWYIANDIQPNAHPAYDK